jgi:hypothetical protein
VPKDRDNFTLELIGFRTLSIVQYSKILKIREHNVSETGSVSVLGSGGRGWFLVSQEYQSNINTWNKACQLGDNRKKNNKNYDNAYTELKLIGQEGANFLQQT